MPLPDGDYGHTVILHNYSVDLEHNPALPDIHHLLYQH